jgi:ADP-heptose:LPS heptosyltransferase
MRKIKGCRHLGAVIRTEMGCGQREIYACGIHGKCTLTPCNLGYAFCMGGQPGSCMDYLPAPGEKLMLVNKLSPGDGLVMTAAIECLHRQHPGDYRIAVDCPWPQIYDHNPNIERPAVPADWRRLEMHYPLINQCNQRQIHFMGAYTDYLAKQLGVPIELDVAHPFLYFGEKELRMAPLIHREARNEKPYWIVCSGCKQDYTAKKWVHDYYQEVVNAFKDRITFVQVGEAHHIHWRLDNVLNAIGRTSLRQLLLLCRDAAGGMGGVTLIQHVFAALEKPYILLNGGRETPSWIHYNTQTTFHTIGALPCCKVHSCWKSRIVPLGDGDHKDTELCVDTVQMREGKVQRCMSMIRPPEVIAAIERYIA